MNAVVAQSKSTETTAAVSICCRICSSDSGRIFAANGFNWLCCQTCRTTQKILTQQEYQKLNPTYDPGDFLDSRDRDQIEAYLNIAGATKVLSNAMNRYLGGVAANLPRRSFLDVGSGMGMYLIAAQRLGFEVLGFEPSADHARVAIQHFQLPIINDYFSADRVSGKKFDLVILSHVIEHIYDPKTFIHELVGVLKPGGALIVITPNNESLVARAIGKAWPMLKPVDHVSMIGARAYDHFNLETLADVHHSTSEFPFEFAASALAALKAFMLTSRRGRSTNLSMPAQSAEPPLRGVSVRAKVLRVALTIVSAPMYVAAIVMRRQACLKSIIVRRA